MRALQPASEIAVPLSATECQTVAAMRAQRRLALLSQQLSPAAGSRLLTSSSSFAEEGLHLPISATTCTAASGGGGGSGGGGDFVARTVLITVRPAPTKASQLHAAAQPPRLFYSLQQSKEKQSKAKLARAACTWRRSGVTCCQIPML